MVFEPFSSGTATKAWLASQLAGLEIIFVDAIDQNAIGFYGRFGFIRLDANSNRIFLTLRQLVN